MRRTRVRAVAVLVPVALALAVEGSPAAAPVASVPSPAPGPSAAVAPLVDDPAVQPQVRLRRLPGGTWVVRGRGPVHGDTGRVVRYTVEVQGSLVARERRAAELLDLVERAFADPRGWTATGVRRMRRVARAPRADVRVVLARPTWVNRACARKGMRTAGRFSCWTGRYAALNLRRWRHGSEVRGFDSLDGYRTYLVNHEVGHGLGHGHRGCPRDGALAPVMVPQSRSLYGCRANPWPYPRR